MLGTPSSRKYNELNTKINFALKKFLIAEDVLKRFSQ